MTSVKSVVFRDSEDKEKCECCFHRLVSFARKIPKPQSNDSEYLPFVYLDDNEELSNYQSTADFTRFQSFQSLPSFTALSPLKSLKRNTFSAPICRPAHHAKLTYSDVQSFGPPSNPLKFSPPEVYHGRRINIRCEDPDNPNEFICAKESIIRIYTSKDPNNYGEEYTSNTAYCRIPKRKTIKTGMGWIEICRILRRSEEDKEDNFQQLIKENTPSSHFKRDYEQDFSSSSSSFSSSSSSSSVSELEHEKNQKTISTTNTATTTSSNYTSKSKPIFFTETKKLVAVKVFPVSEVERFKSRGSENALYEIAAMQMLGNSHPNVLGCHEVLSDGTYIYMIMPYCDGGELFQRLQNNRMPNAGLSEAEARFWFRQILNGMHYLQEHGICHRDLSLENIMLHGNRCKIIDFGYCIKVPYLKKVYHQPDGRITVVKDRRLITPRRPCGRESCIAPEFYNREVIDGFATDLWSVGIILYELLTGQVAYDRPVRGDELFCLLTHELEYLLELCGADLSKEAIDLLKGMFKEDPRDRYTLADMINHPWVIMTD